MTSAPKPAQVIAQLLPIPLAAPVIRIRLPESIVLLKLILSHIEIVFEVIIDYDLY